MQQKWPRSGTEVVRKFKLDAMAIARASGTFHQSNDSNGGGQHTIKAWQSTAKAQPKHSQSTCKTQAKYKQSTKQRQRLSKAQGKHRQSTGRSSTDKAQAKHRLQVERRPAMVADHSPTMACNAMGARLLPTHNCVERRMSWSAQRS